MITTHGGRARTGRATVLATVTAVALTAVQPTLAFAGAAPSARPSAAAAKDTGPTDISARRRHHHYRGNGGAAAAAAFAGIVGTGLAIAAEQNRRSYYEDHYGYGYYGRPAYYGPGPYYYGGGPYYGYDQGW
ncbi:MULTISPECIES: hypothetical protein [unclassified Bradyrhizobium]|uniref:hypothetical protein n=1 Tax=unclassified Bradyrhizobium TaxID=2631580 RepID=UPI0028ECBD57|nr:MULTISPECIES: hypothetical protein [unclassified Bradyrhizobium]